MGPWGVKNSPGEEWEGLPGGMWEDMTCLGVAEQSQLGGVIGNEAGKAVSRTSSGRLPSLVFKGLGTEQDFKSWAGTGLCLF